ncbi:hypothetical protein TUM20985_03350 [Mycobacterium antarcticum]|uniref:PE-PPE domain-containing protein n=1 Tax=Mycolicibacterium sp. TUM20985 TaxID=3023370 RepID=UPI002572562D|nr:PE-PPE domain-containing protein [Mycolicibacterium sp. TUM20985]BDX29788.1 hypothetical protein TUM20985_03350 [Mycolicibacterium sp. TUM20985]
MLEKFLGAVAVAAVIAAPGVSNAAVTFTLGGTGQMADVGQTVPPLNLSGVLSGKYDDGPSVSVPYPATVVGMDYSVAVGADRLVADVQSTPGDKRALGISQGAIAIAEAKRRLMALPSDQRPAPRGLAFVAVADPTRTGHGSLAQLGYQTVDTPYDTTYVTREYDGIADLPDRFNVIAIINAAAGILYVHPYYGELPTNLPARNIRTTVNSAGGIVTDILIPNSHLPMLQPLRDLGLNVDGVEAVLRPVVDMGYLRNDVQPIAKPIPPKMPVQNADADRDDPGAKERPHRNVQASDAAHTTDDATPAKPPTAQDHDPDATPAAPVDKPAEPAVDKPADAAKSTGGDETA